MDSTPVMRTDDIARQVLDLCGGPDDVLPLVQAAIAAAVAAEREACAKVCEDIDPICYDTAGYSHCAAAIRARSK